MYIKILKKYISLVYNNQCIYMNKKYNTKNKKKIGR